MFRNKSKNVSNSAFFAFFVLNLIIVLTLVNCGGGGGGGGGSSGSGTYAVGGSPGGSAPAPVPTSEPISIPPANSKDSYAIFIGMSDYPGNINDLPYASKDANDVYTRLNSSQIWSSGSFKILTNSNATKSAIRAAITEAKNALKENSTFLFFYSGHGTNSGSTGYIIPYDGLTANGGITVGNMINSNELTSYIDELPAGIKKYIVIDSCRSGYFIDAKSLTGDTLKAKFIAMENSDPNFNDELFTKSMTSVANCYVMTSSKGTELSWESGSLQNGVFTYYFCLGLGISVAAGFADGNADNMISAEELTLYVPSRVNAYIVANTSGYTQTPQSYDGIDGDFIVK